MRLAFVQPILAGNAFRERFEHPLSLKSMVLFGAIITFFVALGIALSVASNKRGEKTPQNRETFYEDEVLETKKLERTLSVALLAVAVIAISMALYYVWEPTRQAKMTTSFETRSVRRGQTLFANPGMEGYNNVQSLQCANCHGGYDPATKRYASGGTANYTVKSLKDPETDVACAGDEKFRNPDCITTTVAWRAPALNTALYKYPIRKTIDGQPFASSCSLSDQMSVPDCRSQVYDIITYGRPGTPMPAWGVPGGGPKNAQAVQDLVNFLTSVQLPADQAAQPLRSAAIIAQKTVISDAKKALKDAKDTAIESGTDPAIVKEAPTVIDAQKAVTDAQAALLAIESKTETQYDREASLKDAQDSVDAAQKTVDVSAPAGLIKAQADYNAAVAAYNDEVALNSYGDPQAFLDHVKKDQTQINLEADVEAAKLKKDTKAADAADKKLVEVIRLQNIAKNFLESRDALATAKATLQVFAPRALTDSKVRLAQVQGASDGQLLFESNCARCHTKGWSFFTQSDARVALPAPQGTGAYGPNLASGSVLKQFVDEADQITFIGSGSAFQAPYGARGVGTGRMPGFNSVAGRILTDDQIKAIVEYERNDLTGTGQNVLGVSNLGSGSAPDETGTAKKGK